MMNETETPAEVVGESNVTNIEKAKGKAKARKTTTRGAKGGKAKEKRVAKVKKAKKDTSAPCACMCGETAKGGGFMPGHDSKLSGAIKRVLNGKPIEGERAYVAKVAKSQHPALITDHFRKMLDKIREAK